MSDESVITLDVDQGRVAHARSGERLYVVAGPGSGKTEVVSARIAHLTEEEDLTGDSLLIVSFSRAAVEAIQRRHRRNSPHTAAWVTTLDSLASRLLMDAGVDVSTLGFDARIKRLRKALQEDPEVVEQVRQVEHLIVDEVQDVVGVRADLLAALLDALPDSSGFTLLGDPLQAIYDFQLVPGSLTAEDVRRKAISLRAQETALHGQYRAKTLDAKRAMAMREHSGVRPWIRSMEDFVHKMPQVKPDGITDWVNATDGTIAVLTQTNAQALIAARELHGRANAADLLGPPLNRPVDPWIARVLGRLESSIKFECFAQLLPDIDEETNWERWLTLRRLTRPKGAALDVATVAPRLASGIVPTSLYAPPGRVTISTIHRAKGLEFDRVLLLDPKDWHQGDDEGACGRSLYVAITRPRYRLFTFTTPRDAAWWHGHNAIGRAMRSPKGKKGIIGFEIRGSDWRTNTPPDADGEPERAQEVLAGLGPESPPRAVEVRFNPYDSTSFRPSYDAYLDGQRIGTLGEEFQKDFVRRTGHCDRWPQLEGLYLVGAETVAGPAQSGPVGKNGLWLSPLIVGPASLQWRHL